MLNNVNLMGRLVRDPELRHTQTGTPVATYTLAVNRDFSANGNSEADFFGIVAWQKAAEFANTYFRKGQLVAIQGRLQSRKWTDKDGNNRSTVEVVADRQYFAEGKNKADGAAPQSDNGSFSGNPGEYSGFTELEGDDGDLPF